MTTDLLAGLSELAATLRASTVRVHDPRRRGSGSGVVWNASGLIITNAHVVASGRAVVEFEDGTQTPADVVRQDGERDLAALRVAGAHLAPAAVRDSAGLQLGELVVAVGNPLGLVGALTTGLVQRCNTRWVVADLRLAPGNSGGPLADAAGRVVGINSMVAGGLALAVPSNAVSAFLGESGAVQRRLGVQFVPVRVPLASASEPALLITAIEEGSVAERAGLLLGDVLLASGDVRHFAAMLAAASALDVLRGRARLSVPLAWPQAPEAARAA